MGQRDTLFRHLAILQMLPRAPHKLSTSTVQMRLEEQGYTMTLRSIQRDLEKLAEHFPLECHKECKPYRWNYVANYTSDLPAMDTVTALTLVLAEETVRSLLPKVAIDKIGYKFESARKHLEGMHENGFSQWSQRVRAIPNGKSLIPAEIQPAVWEGLTDALLNHHAVNVEFNVQHYIDQGAFGFPLSQEPVKFIARVITSVAWLLAETPLSHDQSLSEPDADGWVQLTATVPNDQQTQWWIMGFGSGIDVLEPASWREHILQQAREVISRSDDYESPSCDV